MIKALEKVAQIERERSLAEQVSERLAQGL